MSWFSHVPVVGAVESVVHVIAGNHEAANRASRNTASSNAQVPVVGHVQGVVANIVGEHEMAGESYRNASSNMLPPGTPLRHWLTDGGGYIRVSHLFGQSGVSEMAKISAFRASDVYMVRTRGGKTHRGVRLNGRTFTIECNTPADPNLEFADYKIGTVVILAFRGTDDCPVDWARDVFIAVDTFDLFESLASKAPSPRQLCLKHGVSHVHVTGHSLGGAAAIVYANKFKQHVQGCHVFNPGNAFVGFKRAVSPAIQCHCVRGDCISLGCGELPSNTQVYPSWSGAESSHSIENFTVSEAWDRMINS